MAGNCKYALGNSYMEGIGGYCVLLRGRVPGTKLAMFQVSQVITKMKVIQKDTEYGLVPCVFTLCFYLLHAPVTIQAV